VASGRRNLVSVVLTVFAGLVGLGLALWLFGSSQRATASPDRSAVVSVQINATDSGFTEVSLSVSISADRAFTFYAEYGPTTAYGSMCCSGLFGQAEDLPGLSLTMPGLADGTTYHVRVVATDGVNTAYSNDVVVSTHPSGPPTITSRDPIEWGAGCSCIFIIPVVNTKGYETTWHIDYGNTPTGLQAGPTGVFAAIDSDIAVWSGSAYLYFPQPVPQHVYFRMVASNAKGSSASDLYTVAVTNPPTTTAPTPPPRTPPPPPPPLPVTPQPPPATTNAEPPTATAPPVSTTTVPAATAPAACVVPNVIGKPLASARKAFITAHCRLGRVVSRAKAAPAGRVVSQGKKPGSRLANGTAIAVVVARR